MALSFASVTMWLCVSGSMIGEDVNSGALILPAQALTKAHVAAGSLFGLRILMWLVPSLSRLIGLSCSLYLLVLDRKHFLLSWLVLRPFYILRSTMVGLVFYVRCLSALAW